MKRCITMMKMKPQGAKLPKNCIHNWIIAKLEVDSKRLLYKDKVKKASVSRL